MHVHAKEASVYSQNFVKFFCFIIYFAIIVMTPIYTEPVFTVAEFVFIGEIYPDMRKSICFKFTNTYLF
jgi:hypothetical protein